MRLYPAHIRKANICMSGARKWAAHHKLDWSAFVSEGIDESVIAELDDYFGNKIIAEAKKEDR